jgi:sirohydrochlorin ferrochelatase
VEPGNEASVNKSEMARRDSKDRNPRGESPTGPGSSGPEHVAEPSTTERAQRHTAESANERIHRQTEANIAYYSSRLDDIERRLKELEEEWDIERTLEANAAVVGLIGLAAALRKRSWILLPFAVSAVLLQYALQGWCPAVPVLRRLGFRTASEIEKERTALRRARGDFR